jgi:hypothetical protein
MDDFYKIDVQFTVVEDKFDCPVKGRLIRLDCSVPFMGAKGPTDLASIVAETRGVAQGVLTDDRYAIFVKVGTLFDVEVVKGSIRDNMNAASCRLNLETGCMKEPEGKGASPAKKTTRRRAAGPPA